MKAGTEYFHAWFDDEAGKVVIDTETLRTIRGGYGYLIEKVPGVTWGKLSKKHGDFGWLKSIPDYARTRFRVTDGVPSGYGLTKSAAVRSALAAARRGVARYTERHGADTDAAEYQAEIAALAAKLKRV